jgi:prohibitin 2
MNPSHLARIILVGVLVFVLVIASSTATYVVQPGTRGIKVTLGKAADKFLPEGFGFKTPFVTSIVAVNVRQRTQNVRAECFSSDLQQVTLELRVLYRVPEASVVQIFKQYAGDPFDSLIAPRVQEAMKEVTALLTAEQIVKGREEAKGKALAAARSKVGEILWIEAAQARFTQMQTQVEAETAVINAKGEAEAIRVRGEALRLNPAFLRLKIVERWNGKSPLVVPAGQNSTGAGLLLPLGPEPVAAP